MSRDLVGGIIVGVLIVLLWHGWQQSRRELKTLQADFRDWKAG